MSKDREGLCSVPCSCERASDPHAPWTGACRGRVGRAAREAIINRLNGWPKAKKIAGEISDFYGDYLRYHENEGLESSHFEIRLRHEPVSLHYALIELKLGTPRTAEALSHELLHLHSRVRGYPMGEMFWIPGALVHYAAPLVGMHPIIGNLLEHELIIETFLDLGFDKANFLDCLLPPPDYQYLASKAYASCGYMEEIGFPWWCLEYFRHWVSTRHWVQNELGVYAESALYWGSKVHPEMKEAAKKIRALIESGALTDEKRHRRYVNAILELMRVPKFTQWAIIQTGYDGKPVAMRLTGTIKTL